jgi:DNA-3-methyladenine glycosylase II
LRVSPASLPANSWQIKDQLMGISADGLRASLDTIAKMEPKMKRALDVAGYPEPRIRDRGYETLLRTIVGQQVSVKAAQAIWNKLEAGLGDLSKPQAILGKSEDTLRSFGLSRQKQGYALSLAALVEAGQLDLHNLPADDEEAIALMTEVKGIGRWSAEIYLLFAEGRTDIWPAGDLAVQIQLGKIMGLKDRPTERKTREIAEAWRPHRGAAAVFTWHCYNTETI